MSKELTICSIGDIMLCDSPLFASVGVGTKYGNNPKDLFVNCIDEIRSADIVLGNFETVVYKPKNRNVNEVQMCCSTKVVQELSNCGFSILNVANNHCMQHGVEAFQNTIATCKEYNIQPIGIRNEEPYIVEKKGYKIAFLSLCIHIEWYEPDHILYEDRIDQILRNIRSLRDNDADILIIVSVHWGDEYATYPSNAQVELAHRMVDIGANVILGHHSHVYQGIEEYKGAIIAYSQGNFISDMAADLCRETGVLTLTFLEGRCISYKACPFYIDDNYVLQKSESKWLKDRQQALEEVLSGNITDDEYWRMIKLNHDIGHRAFVEFFKDNISNYSVRVLIKMILDFLGRKFKRIVGTTTDGRISSMDSSIREHLLSKKND